MGIPRTDEHAAERERFHAWCRREGIDPKLWMPDQPWCGYENSRVQDNWLGWLACATAPVKVHHACDRHMGIPFTFTAVATTAIRACPHCEAEAAFGVQTDRGGQP